MRELRVEALAVAEHELRPAPRSRGTRSRSTSASSASASGSVESTTSCGRTSVAAEARRLADERQHELVRRPLVEVLRRADLLDAPVVHEHDLVGDLHRLLLVVRDEDRRDVHLVVETAQPLAELLPHARVERAERLVEEQHLRLDRERARERHALPLAAGELRRIALAEPLELHELEQLVHALADLRLRPLAHRQAERDVVGDRHVLERRVVLEDEADAALLRPQPRRLASRR